MTKGPFQLLKPYVKENRWYIAVGLFCLVVVDLLQLIIPRVIKGAVDAITSFSIDASGLLAHGGVIVGLALGIGLFRYGWRRFLFGTSRRVEEGLRNRLFSHLQTLSASYYTKTSTGDIMAHTTNDIQNIRMATGMGIVALNDAVFMGSAAICFMLYIHVKLTLLVLIPMPLIALFTRIFSRRMFNRYKNVQAAFSTMTETARERFSGIRAVKNYTLHGNSVQRFKKVSDAYIEKNMGLVRVTGAFHPLMMMFSHLSMVLVLYFGGRHTIFQQITPGDFVAFISYLGLLTWPMMAMGWVTNLIQRGKASLTRINAILSEKPDIAAPPNPVSPGRISGGIRFDGVGFSHNPDKSGFSLKDISFEVKPGEILGIVGPPGSGKSTLAALIPRVYDVTSGAIFLDGYDVRRLRVSDLRSAVAFVPQEPFLFAGTIRENVDFYQNMDEKQLKKAVEKAALDQTVAQFPNEYETIVGEKGVVLSGGQKQRVALARAFLKDAPVLVLDDPVSQVDTRTANRIIEAVRSQAGRKTLIIISHRLAALRYADRIITLENGRITESGTHESLRVAGGFYASANKLQELEEVLDD